MISVREIVEKTLQDTIAFMRIYLRMMEGLKKKVEEREDVDSEFVSGKLEGISDCIELFKDWVEKGVDAVELMKKKYGINPHNDILKKVDRDLS